jgi:hypothetical protein
MKRWWMVAATVVVGLGLPTGVASQERDWDRIADRVARAVERAIEQAGRATEQALAALENVEWDVHWDDEHWYADEADAGPRVQEEFRWTGSVDRGDLLEIKGVNGPISATPASGNQVEVVAIKSGRRSDPATVTIDVIEHAGGVTLCAVYPTPEGERANECGVGEDGRNSIRRNDVRVSWEIRVPDGVEFRGRTVNGDVEATGLGARVDVATVNGDVTVGTTGFAAARTVNGSIEARMGGELRDDVSFETVNGSIRLDVDDGLDANVDASWLNGSLETEIPFQVRGRMGRRSAEGTLGSGGATMRLRTVNGSIRIY